MSETMTRAAELTIVAGRSVGTICLWGPCMLCERPFAVQNGERVLAANDKDGRRVGAVCPDCASCDEAALGQKLQARAERLRRKADELERWVSGESILASPSDRRRLRGGRIAGSYERHAEEDAPPCGRGVSRRQSRMIRAVLFDLEGTLLQTEALEALTFAYAVTELRPDLDETEVARSCMALGDRPRPEVADELLRGFDLEAAARERAREIGARTPRQVLVDLKLRAFDGALSDPATVLIHSYPRNVALARRLHRNGRRTALYTRLRWRQARSTLAALDPNGAYDFVATAEDVDRGKPDPEANLLAARELDVPPEECLAVEGFPAGVEAALAARMPVVTFTTPLTRQRFGDADLLYRCWTVEDSHAICSVANRMDNGVHNATRG